jgi:hypothetical protein
MVEVLEDRRLLSIIAWSGGGDGKLWNDTKNWVGGLLPGPTDDAVIGSAFASQTITSTANVTIDKITSEASFQITAGTFTVGTTVQVDNTFTISGGILTHLAGQSGFDLTVTGDLTVETGGAFNVDGKGNGGSLGTGKGTDASYCGSGGGYGGVGGSSTQVSGVPRMEYSLRQPSDHRM